MKLKFAAVLVYLFCTVTAWAVEPFVVRDIRVDGVQRTEAGTVFSYLPIKVGDTLDDEKSTNAIKALYKTGFYKDVKLQVENNVLIVKVVERPSIARVTINGAKEFEPDKLKKGLKQAGLAESRIFGRSVLESAEQELKRQYISRGKYAVKITTTTTPMKRNRVAINFDIEEGRTARIKQINFVGNKSFDVNELRDLFSLSTPGILSWFNKNDQYSKQKLSADLETLRSHYLDQGYLEFNIDSTQVSITPDMQDIYITVNLTEGKQFTVSDIKMAGDMKVPEEELQKLIQFKPGEVFARKKLTESIKLITDRLGNEGYAFANVNAAPEVDKENQKTAFTFFVNPGNRVYVRRINISGNDRTRDEVIRREFRQMEGGWHSTSDINRSKQRVDKLFYFKSVDVETPPVPGAPDQVDVNMKVVEKPTGAVMFGAGFSDRQGLILNASVSQNNIFGTGNFVSVQVNTGSINKTLSASFTDPYFTVDGISLGFDVFQRKINTNRLRGVNFFRTDTIGASFRMGLPIAENDIVSFGLGAERIKVASNENSSQRNRDFIEEFGQVTNNFPFTISWARDRRDSAIYTTSGTTHRLFAEVSVPGGDLNYYKLSYHQKIFYPITDFFTFLLNTEAGIGGGYTGKDLPFFKNFFAGGNNSVRGFDLNTLGPRETQTLADGSTRRVIIGGSKRLVGNAEILFPVPFMTEDKSIRLSAFIDAGTVFGGKIDFDEMRYSTGIAVTWISPMGPLKVSLAKPLRKEDGDRLQVFQFQFGQQF